MTKIQNLKHHYLLRATVCFGHCHLGHWVLFVIWCLYFVISFSTYALGLTNYVLLNSRKKKSHRIGNLGEN